MRGCGCNSCALSVRLPAGWRPALRWTARRLPPASCRAGLTSASRLPACLPAPHERSMQMSQWLLQQGFQRVKNCTGSIDSYSRIDPSVPQY